MLWDVFNNLRFACKLRRETFIESMSQIGSSRYSNLFANISGVYNLLTSATCGTSNKFVTPSRHRRRKQLAPTSILHILLLQIARGVTKQQDPPANATKRSRIIFRKRLAQEQTRSTEFNNLEPLLQSSTRTQGLETEARSSNKYVSSGSEQSLSILSAWLMKHIAHNVVA